MRQEDLSTQWDLQQKMLDGRMAQLMPLLLTVSCFSEIQIGFTFLVPAHPGSPRKRAVKRVCVCVWHKRWHKTEIFECNKLCLHLHLSQDFMQDRDFSVYELAYIILTIMPSTHLTWSKITGFLQHWFYFILRFAGVRESIRHVEI